MTTPTLSNPPPKTIEALLNDDCMKKGASIDGSSVGFALVNQSDLRLKPDPKGLYYYTIYYYLNHVKKQFLNYHQFHNSQILTIHC